MKSMYLVLALLCAFAASTAMAAEPAFKMSPLEAALNECANKVKKDSEGMPDQKAMSECMKAKGFGDADPSAPKAKTKAK